MSRYIHIFNPDTDYALATTAKVYTPPSRIESLCRSMSLLPSIYAAPEDLILSLYPQGATHNKTLAQLAEDRGLRIITLADIGSYNDMMADELYNLLPWGWNPSLLRVLSNVGVSPDNMPGMEEITQLRELSHRRYTIEANRQLHELGIGDNETPKEFYDVNSALEFQQSNPDCIFKAPWSSSGRGIMHCSGLEYHHIEPWLRGIIKHQGSVMAETFFKKKIDFASEWLIDRNEARFLGWSVFKTSLRGKFHYNLLKTQEEITCILSPLLHRSPEELISAQKRMLETIISGKYCGYAGIDMMCGEEGTIRPCVEINLRSTMGITVIKIIEQAKDDVYLQRLIKNRFGDAELVLQRLTD